MKGHGGFPTLSWPSGNQDYKVAVLGAGAAPPVAPAGVAYPFADGATPDFPVAANALSRVAAEAPTRSGVGTYAITVDLSFLVPAYATMHVDVFGAAGVWGQVANWNPKTRVINVRTFAAGGAAVDLLGGGTPDLLVIDVRAHDSVTRTAGAGG